MALSLAYKVTLALVFVITFERLFIYKVKSRGPSIEPCGTPQLTKAGLWTLKALISWGPPPCFVLLLFCIVFSPFFFVCLIWFISSKMNMSRTKTMVQPWVVGPNLYRTQNPPSNSQRHDARTVRCKIVNPCPSTLHNNTHENWSPGGLNQLINIDNKITLNSSTPYPHHNNVSPVKYIVNELYKLKDASLAHRVSAEVRKRVSELGIKKRVRGRRAGHHMHKKIPVVHITSTIPSSPVNTTSQNIGSNSKVWSSTTECIHQLCSLRLSVIFLAQCPVPWK